MITFLSLAMKKQENNLLKKQMRVQAARWTEENWRYELFEKLNELERFLDSEPVLDLISWDVTIEGALERLADVRRSYRQAALLVIADASVSPTEYLKPSVLPSALLLKPLSDTNIQPVMEEMMRFYLERFEEKSIEDSFVIDTREGRQYVPFAQIYYIEARDKKIYVRTMKEEFGFYGTIDDIENGLPENFCRCHRSYIVNMSKVRAVRLSRNLLELEAAIEVPLSRSYKKAVKGYNPYGS